MVDEKGGLDIGVVRVVLDELEAALQPHDHKGGGHGIGIPCFGTDHGGTEERVADRAACGRVDGVGVAHPVLLVVFTVVAGGDYGAVGEGDGGFDFLCAIFVLRGTLDAYGPGGAIGFGTLGAHLAAHVDEVVGDIQTVEQSG